MDRRVRLDWWRERTQRAIEALQDFDARLEVWQELLDGGDPEESGTPFGVAAHELYTTPGLNEWVESATLEGCSIDELRQVVER